ncbi:MAG TPA: Lrp/AsnC family transcriptional regulator [Nitrososphaera sp.]|nr:Lrp/AsnC family transcriptional regulator [Nitrososphaera sp.]
MTRDDVGYNMNGASKMVEGKVSRAELLQELFSMGVETELLEHFSLEQLQNLASRTKRLDRTFDDEVESLATGRNARSSGDFDSGSFPLTVLDKKILQSLLASGGRVSSLAISRKLEIPLTAVLRRRKRLESEFLDLAYSLKISNLGWRKADLLISTSKRDAYSIGKELLTHNSITLVSRSIGVHTIHLHANIIFRNNIELLNLIEWIKSVDGVKDVVWTEPLELVGTNIARPLQIIAQYEIS